MGAAEVEAGREHGVGKLWPVLRLENIKGGETGAPHIVITHSAILRPSIAPTQGASV